jgi:hypothetical protein
MLCDFGKEAQSNQESLGAPVGSEPGESQISPPRDSGCHNQKDQT